MSVEEMIEYHNHKAIIEDMEAEEVMKQWYQLPAESKPAPPFREADS